MGQKVKGLALALRGFGLLLWHSFDPWTGNFHTLCVQSEEKKKKKKSGLFREGSEGRGPGKGLAPHILS